MAEPGASGPHSSLPIVARELVAEVVVFDQHVEAVPVLVL
jgi:hypothetical protein